MDLLERGRRIGDLGRGLSWFDIKTLLMYLPHDSHVRRLLTPEEYLKGELSTTHAQLMGEAVDSINLLTAVTRGADAHALENLPRSIDVWRGGSRPRTDEEKTPAEPEKKALTPSEIRAEIAARQKLRSEKV